MKGRKRKDNVLQLLRAPDFDGSLNKILRLPGRQTVNPLFSFFYNRSEDIKWRAVTAMGAVVASLAEHDVESARVVMRRLMWNLNDESGGIGWGSPEAMGEIIARSDRLASEYIRMLISYADPAGNFLEHEILQRGVLWGLGRAAGSRAALMRDGWPLLKRFLTSLDPYHRGLAARAAGKMAAKALGPLLENLTGDQARLEIYRCPEIRQVTVGDLAARALLDLS